MSPVTVKQLEVDIQKMQERLTVLEEGGIKDVNFLHDAIDDLKAENETLKQNYEELGGAVLKLAQTVTENRTLIEQTRQTVNSLSPLASQLISITEAYLRLNSEIEALKESLQSTTDAKAATELDKPIEELRLKDFKEDLRKPLRKVIEDKMTGFRMRDLPTLSGTGKGAPVDRQRRMKQALLKLGFTVKVVGGTATYEAPKGVDLSHILQEPLPDKDT